MKLSQLFASWAPDKTLDCEVSGIQNDSRHVQPGDLFVAYKGATADARLFIDKAVIAGAMAIVYDPDDFPTGVSLPDSLPCIAIPHLAIKLASIACDFYGNPGHDLALTGVTGTNGKTTIAYQLAQAYDLLGQKAAYIGTIGEGNVNRLNLLANTTPDALCLQKLLSIYKSDGVKQVCLEVSSHALSQHRVDAIDFKQAIFTNLTLDHLDYHHSMEEYAAAKALLFGCESLKCAIINHDDSYGPFMASRVATSSKILTYGMHVDSDVRAVKWEMDVNGTQVDIHSPWGQHQVYIKALGQFNIYNSLAVWSSILASGYTPEQLIPVMSELKAAPGRMEVVAHAPYVLVDYAHTPDALENALKTLKQLKTARLWVVFGCGGDRDKSKRPVMGKVASSLADHVVITSDNPRTEDPQTIISEISQGLLPSARAVELIHREEAILYALNSADEKDIILIAGKGHEAYQQIGALKHAFSDQEVVSRWSARASASGKKLQ